MLNTLTKSNPILIGKNDSEIRKQKDAVIKTATNCNEFLNEIEKILGFELTEAQKRGVVNDRLTTIVEILRQRTNNITAGVEFILSSQGLTKQSFIPIWNKYHYIKSVYLSKCTYVDKQFQISKDFIVELDKTYTFYAKTDQQIKAYNTLKTLADALNQSIKEGLIVVSDYNGFHRQLTKTRLIENFNSTLTVKDNKIIPSWQYIDNLEVLRK